MATYVLRQWMMRRDDGSIAMLETEFQAKDAEDAQRVIDDMLDPRIEGHLAYFANGGWTKTIERDIIDTKDDQNWSCDNE